MKVPELWALGGLLALSHSMMCQVEYDSPAKGACPATKYLNDLGSQFRSWKSSSSAELTRERHPVGRLQSNGHLLCCERAFLSPAKCPREGTLY